jgi:hypothetical protein
MRAPDEKKRSRASANDYGEMFEAVSREPRFRLMLAQHFFAQSGNPVHVWEAIAVCIKHEREFPDWVVGYLGGCAERMLSDKARKVHDLRAVLRWVLDFKPKPGRGNPLAFGSYRGNVLFALKFATEIKKGKKPSTALASASEVLDNDRFDDKTLRGWLLEFFEQGTWLRTNAEWKNVVRSHFGGWRELLRELSREIAS